MNVNPETLKNIADALKQAAGEIERLRAICGPEVKRDSDNTVQWWHGRYVRTGVEEHEQALAKQSPLKAQDILQRHAGWLLGWLEQSPITRTPSEKEFLQKLREDLNSNVPGRAAFRISTRLSSRGSFSSSWTPKELGYLNRIHDWARTWCKLLVAEKTFRNHPEAAQFLKQLDYRIEIRVWGSEVLETRRRAILSEFKSILTSGGTREDFRDALILAMFNDVRGPRQITRLDFQVLLSILDALPE